MQCLSLPSHLGSVVPLPGSPTRTTLRLVVQMSLSETTGLASSRGETTHLAVLGVGLADPLDVWVTTNSPVEGIEHDHFIKFVGGVLGHPVAVENSQTLATTTSTLLKQNKNLVSSTTHNFETINR